MRVSLQLQTLYADVLQQLVDRRVAAGSVYVQRASGGTFLYVRRTVGRLRLDRYLGPADDPAAQELAMAIRAEQALARGRRSLISALKRAGLPAPGRDLARVLDVMSDAGLFESGVLVGTAAYQCYGPLLGVRLPASSLMTQDADFATPDLKIAARDSPASLLEILRRADPSFAAIPGQRKGAPPSAFRSGAGFRVDVLTPVLRRSDTIPMRLTGLGAGAAPLQYLAWLLSDPVPALVLAGAGVLVQVPQPARYAVHKLILAQRRPPQERVKRAKDLVQAKHLIVAMRDIDKVQLTAALRSARAKGREGWSEPIARSLGEIDEKL